jgi:mandelate racemase
MLQPDAHAAAASLEASPQTTIRSINVRAALVPLRRPVIAGIGRFDTWPLVLVDIETSGGITGHAYVAPYRAQAVPAVVAMLRDLGSTLTGEPVAPVRMFEGAFRALNVVGLSGVTVIASSALDMALWDALGKEAGLPLAALLGGTIGPMRAYNSNGLWRHEITTLAREARDLAQEGSFTAMKLRLGNEHLRDDLAAIAAVRDGIGTDMDLMVDFNQALGLGDAIRRCHELDDQGLYWFEEPISYDNVRGYAQLAGKVRTPLQIGENYYGARDLLTFLEAGGVHYAMGDLMRIGGVTGWMRTAAVAGAAGIQFSNHLYPEIAAHLLRVTPSAHWLEWVDWAAPVLADPLTPTNGHVSADNRPGIGMCWDEKAVERYAIRV